MSNKQRARRPPPRKSVDDRRRTWILAGVVGGVIAVALGIAIAAGGGSDPGGGSGNSTEGTEIASVEVVGGALPTFESGQGDPAVGRDGPRLRGVDFAGEPVAIGGPGEATIVVLVAHWCPHCQQDLPVVTGVLRDAGSAGVKVVAVSSLASSERPNWPPSAWFEEVGWPGDVLLDDADASAYQALGASGTPFTVVLDREGKVVRRLSGEVGSQGFRALLDLAREA